MGPCRAGKIVEIERLRITKRDCSNDLPYSLKNYTVRSETSQKVRRRVA